jgi:hypothetical protein
MIIPIKGQCISRTQVRKLSLLSTPLKLGLDAKPRTGSFQPEGKLQGCLQACNVHIVSCSFSLEKRAAIVCPGPPQLYYEVAAVLLRFPGLAAF